MTTDLIARHVESMVKQRLSMNTVLPRVAALRRLPCAPELLTREVFDQWWDGRQMLENGQLRAARSLATELSHIQTFYRWALRERLIPEDPVLHAVVPKIPGSKPRPIREPDLAKAFHEAPPVMRRILALGSMAGLRAAEIAAVKWSDLDEDAGVLWVRHGKGDKDRSVPAVPAFVDMLEVPDEFGQDECIVTNRAGKPLSPKSVSARTARYLRGLGINSTTHKLRARYATKFLAATGNLVETAEVLGHASTTTTQAYTLATGKLARKGARAAGKIGR